MNIPYWTRRTILGATLSLLCLASAEGKLMRGHGVVPAAPAAITAPISGTPLTSEWALQGAGATGPTVAFSNGTWGGTIDGYLTGLGFSAGGFAGLYINPGSGTITVSNYDFTDAPVIGVADSTGTVIFFNCKFKNSRTDPQQIGFPCNFAGTISTTSGTVTVMFDRCEFDRANIYWGAGTLSLTRNRIKNQPQYFTQLAYTCTAPVSFTFTGNYSTGCGILPAALAHVEIFYFHQNSAAGMTITITGNFFDLKDGQTTCPSWGSGWTGYAYIESAATVTISNNIAMGALAANANPINPNTVATFISYNNTSYSACTITNNVFDTGWINGFIKNQSGGSNRAIDGGGNRTIGNVAIAAGMSGWN